MAANSIDELLQACVNRGASEIHLTKGQAPAFRLAGQLHTLETNVLGSEDTIALMKSITPERCQRELEERGTCEFGFAFGDEMRFSVSVVQQPRGSIHLVLRQIPTAMRPKS